MKGWTSTTLPDKAKMQMLASDRSKLGKAGRTMIEIDAKNEAKSERELQEQIAGLLRIKCIYFVRSRMDRKTTTKVGTPDFLVCLNGRFEGWEIKVGNNGLSDEQRAACLQIIQSGGMARLITTLDRAKQIIDDVLGRGK